MFDCVQHAKDGLSVIDFMAFFSTPLSNNLPTNRLSYLHVYICYMKKLVKERKKEKKKKHIFTCLRHSFSGAEHLCRLFRRKKNGKCLLLFQKILIKI